MGFFAKLALRGAERRYMKSYKHEARNLAYQIKKGDVAPETHVLVFFHRRCAALAERDSGSARTTYSLSDSILQTQFREYCEQRALLWFANHFSVGANELAAEMARQDQERKDREESKRRTEEILKQPDQRMLEFEVSQRQ